MPLLLLAIAAALTAKATPSGKTAGWFTSADYPVDALLERQQGVVGFALQVDPAGKPTSCRIYRGSGSQYLDDATCALAMERARFKPPRRLKRIRKGRRRGRLQPTGPAIASTYRHAVRWRLPNSGDVSDQTFVVRSVMGPSGDIDTCTMTGPGALGGGTSCGLFGSRTFLAGMLRDDYRRTAFTEVRLDLVGAATASRQTRNPDAYWRLGEAAVTFAADGRLSRCIGLKALTSGSRSTDLCKLLKAQPPRVPPSTGERRATYLLDLSAYYR